MSATESTTEQPCQDEVLDLLTAAWAKHPGLRLGQLIDYALEAAGIGAGAFYADNRALVKALEKAAKRARLPK